MSGQLRPDEATSALAEIGRQQEKAIEAALVPAWYWWAVAAGMVAIGAAVDSHSAVVRGVVITVAVVVIAGLTAAAEQFVAAHPDAARWPSSASSG